MPPFNNDMQPKLASNDKLYTIINNKAYDITEFIKEHPGGPVIKTQLFMDATDSFNAFHPPSIQEILNDYYDDELTKELNIQKTQDNEFLKDIRKLKKEIEKEGLFKSYKPFYIMIAMINFSIFGTSFYLLSYYNNNSFALVLSAALLGLFWQQCGWHSHEYLHHQVFENREWNNLIGGLFFGGVCQGFSTAWWKDKHNTHHASPNVHNDDPDIDTHPFLAWSENAMELYAGLSDQELATHMKRFMLHNQSLIFFPLLAFARLSWCAHSLWYAVTKGQLGDPKKQKVYVSPLEVPCLLLHWFIYFAMVFYYPSTLFKSFLYLFVSQTSSGILLATCFTLNHNGMVVYTKEQALKRDFYRLQIETGRDVHPSYFMTWFTGGLNYQIEHHLFPTLPRHNFQYIQKRVQDLCKKYGISYHCTGFIEGTWEVLERLERVSKKIEMELY